ncbi:hypothetical protein D3C80_213820 [compost metagenome]
MLFLFQSCMKDDYPVGENVFYDDADGVFITNEGNFMYGNASLSYYSPEKKTIINDAFFTANGIPLGDVAQSMEIRNGLGYVVVNNSGKIYVIDIKTFKLVGKITGLTSPRYIYFMSDEKAYVTDLYAKAITIINPKTYTVTGKIDVNNNYSQFYQHPTEQMVIYNNWLFVSCWSYDDKVLVIDTNTDKVVKEITVGKQPNSIVIDKNNKVWVICDGGYKGSPYGYENPSLIKIDAKTFSIEKVFDMEKGENQPSKLTINGHRDTIYYLNNGVWQMPVNAQQLSANPLIPEKNPGKKDKLFYGLGINPKTSEVYITDAIDYLQNGILYRYLPSGKPVDSCKVGIIPGSFCFKDND